MNKILLHATVQMNLKNLPQAKGTRKESTLEDYVCRSTKAKLSDRK